MNILSKSILLLILSIGSAPFKSMAQSDYKAQIAHYRDSIDNYFRTDSHSPIDSADKPSFHGIHYYEIDSNYRIPFTFKRKKWGKQFLMKTTTDRLPAYKVYGTIEFKLDGKPQKLTLYQNLELKKRKGYEDYLFCPFKDLTNGEDSYGGGRYIDFRMKDLENGIIDFNLSYNPYCAYNYRYSCPIPPKSNHLKIAVKAGVKKFH
jgi:uncharacterized protein